jgi:ribonucleoside-triphosphate reductase
MKHYKNGLEWIEELNSDVIDEFVKSIDIENTSIEDPKYKQYDKVYRYALKLTTKETCQAVEGMYHNLNTLQSRSGNQLERVAA